MIKEIALVQLEQYHFIGASTGSHMPTGLMVSFVYPSFWETKVQLTSQRLSVHTKGCNHSLLRRGSLGEGAGKKGEKEGARGTTGRRKGRRAPLPNLRAINPMERSLCGGERCNHLNWIEFPLSMSMMSPVIFRPWLEVPLGFEPTPPAHQSSAGAQLRRLNSV